MSYDAQAANNKNQVFQSVHKSLGQQFAEVCGLLRFRLLNYFIWLGQTQFLHHGAVKKDLILRNPVLVNTALQW